jgi:hypothetical protein
MAENKKGFILYADQRGTFTKLSDEQAGKLVKHIFAYVNDEDPESDFITELAFESIKQKLKRDLAKWEATRGKRSAAGLKSAEVKRNKRQQELTNSTSVKSVQQAPTKSTVNVNVNDNVNDNVNVNVKDIKENTKVALAPFVFKKSLLDYGFEKQLVEDFLKNRKTKKLTNTKTAYDSFIEEIEKTRRDKNELFKIIVQKGWGGFKSSWPINENNNNNGATSPHHNIDKNANYDEQL